MFSTAGHARRHVGVPRTPQAGLRRPLSRGVPPARRLCGCASPSGDGRACASSQRCAPTISIARSNVGLLDDIACDGCSDDCTSRCCAHARDARLRALAARERLPRTRRHACNAARDERDAATRRATAPAATTASRAAAGSALRRRRRARARQGPRRGTPQTMSRAVRKRHQETARQARRAAASCCRRAEIEELFSRLARAQSQADHRTRIQPRRYELLVAVTLSAQATDVGVNKATRKLFPVANTPAADRRAGRGRPEAATSPLSACSTPRPRTWWRWRSSCSRQHGGEVPRSREALEALPGRRPQDRERGAQHRLRRTDHRGRHAYLPRRQPHRPGAGQGRARGGRRAGEGGAAAVPARRAPLADPAWPLRLQGAQAGLPALRRSATCAATRTRRRGRPEPVPRARTRQHDVSKRRGDVIVTTTRPNPNVTASNKSALSY